MEDDVRRTLYAWLETFAAAESLPVAFPGWNFEPGGEPYLRVQVFPTRPSLMGVKTGWSIHTWLFQVSVYIRPGKGDLSAQSVADRLRTALTHSTRLTGSEAVYTVIGQADIAPHIAVEGWLAVPVTFRIQATR